MGRENSSGLKAQEELKGLSRVCAKVLAVAHQVPGFGEDIWGPARIEAAFPTL